METSEQFLDRAMKLLQRSDPIPKLLPQVRLGRMPKDSPALAAILDSWLEAFVQVLKDAQAVLDIGDRKSTRLNSSHGYISYAVFCLKKKKPTCRDHRLVDPSAQTGGGMRQRAVRR